MIDKIHIVCCLIQGTNVKRKYGDYFTMTRYCIASLIQVDIEPANITCIAENKVHCTKLSKEFGVNTVEGPPIPKEISHMVSKKGGRKLFMYKPICLSKCFPRPVDDTTVMVMTDVDALFVGNPCSLDCQTDVWSQHAYRYLRPSRARSLARKYRCPDMCSLADLSGYFGSQSQAYLFMKHKQNRLPQYRLTSNLVYINPQVYSELIDCYYNMCLDVMLNKPEYCKGDQEILSAAIDVLGLSYAPYAGLPCSVQFNGGQKLRMVRKAAKMGLRLR